jgi:hypothetical protein
LIVFLVGLGLGLGLGAIVDTGSPRSATASAVSLTEIVVYLSDRVGRVVNEIVVYLSDRVVGLELGW